MRPTLPQGLPARPHFSGNLLAVTEQQNLIPNTTKQRVVFE
jgi:hypothetical protein